MRTRRRFLKESAVLLAAAPLAARGQEASEFDYVIVGTSPSGCVLADRLSARAGTRVLIVEAGSPDTNPLIRVPGKHEIDRIADRRPGFYGPLVEPNGRD